MASIVYAPVPPQFPFWYLTTVDTAGHGGEPRWTIQRVPPQGRKRRRKERGGGFLTRAILIMVGNLEAVAVRRQRPAVAVVHAVLGPAPVAASRVGEQLESHVLVVARHEAVGGGVAAIGEARLEELGRDVHGGGRAAEREGAGGDEGRGEVHSEGG